MSAVVSRGWEQYLLQLRLHPLRTKVDRLFPVSPSSSFSFSGGDDRSNIPCGPSLQAITAGILAGISDSVAQKLSGFQRIQLRRLLLKMLFGFVHGGSFGHFFHKLLDKIFKGKKDSKTVAKKVLLEQITSSPWNHLLFLLYYGLIVEGRPWVEVKNRVKNQYPSVQLTAWMFWPIVGWINHQYMPLQFRVIFHSCVACCWGIFLNLRARRMSITK